jgi:hypothetical protein
LRRAAGLYIEKVAAAHALVTQAAMNMIAIICSADAFEEQST